MPACYLPAMSIVRTIRETGILPCIPVLFLLISTWMINPIATLFRICILTPRFRLHQSFGPPNGLELTILQDFSDQHRFMRVLVGFIYHDLAAGGQELLPIDGFADFVHLRRTSLFNRLLPYIHAKICGLDRIIGDSVFSIRQIIPLAIGLEVRHKLLVLW